MQTTREIFEAHTGNLVDKWNHYFEIYDRYFTGYVGKEVAVLEIGVSQGGSIDLWKKFFGKKLRYYGIDINPGCKKFEGENVKIFIGSQEDVAFLEKVKTEIEDLDIIMDDGGHTMKQQITSFQTLFSKVKYGGIYLCEDNITSYWYQFGGGLKRKNTFIEYIKNLVDVMHLWHAGKDIYLKENYLKEHIYSIHIYNSIVVLEKRKIEKPYTIQKGNVTVGYVVEEKNGIIYKLGYKLFGLRNRISSAFRKL